MQYIVCALLFFSSRRRHTRFDCDWSSDVCSSDLAHEQAPETGYDPQQLKQGVVLNAAVLLKDETQLAPTIAAIESAGRSAGLPLKARSEERRVGKECRSRGSPYH